MNFATSGIIASGFRAGGGGGGQTAKIDFTGDDDATSDPGWNNFLASLWDTPLNLLSPDGDALGWTIVVTGAAPFGYGPPDYVTGDADFPYDVVISQMAVSGSALDCAIAGLNPAKTYALKIAIACSGSGDVDATAGDETQSGLSAGNQLAVALFGNTSPDSGGNLAVSVNGTSNYSAINGLIITENSGPI
jgi:hypothetical protein